jgi:hypothetical protein
MKKLHRLACNKRPVLPWVMAIVYSFDFSVLPPVNAGFWGWLVISSVISKDIHVFLVMFSTIILLNVMTSTIYALLQRDSLWLVPFTLAIDLYNQIFINTAWFAATADEMRKTKMNWH